MSATPPPVVPPRTAIGAPGAPAPRRRSPLILILVVCGALSIMCIGLLAAILFPVFASARIMARKSVAMTEIKSVASVSLTYAADYDDRLAPESEWRTAVAPYASSVRLANGDPLPLDQIVMRSGTGGTFLAGYDSPHDGILHFQVAPGASVEQSVALDAAPNPPLFASWNVYAMLDGSAVSLTPEVAIRRNAQVTYTPPKR